MQHSYHKYLCLLIICGISFLAQGARQPTAEELKTAYIFNFTRYIIWPEEASGKSQLSIVYYGNNTEYWNALQYLKQRSVRNMNFVMRKADSLSSILPADIIVVDPSKNAQIRQITENLDEHAILLITEEVSDKSKIGINFIKQEDKTLSFEINRYNLVYQKLDAKPEIVILGGTEIEIATLVKDMERSLEQSRQQLAKQTKELQSVQQQVISKQKQLEQQQNKLAELDKSIVQYKQRYDDLSKNYESMLDSLQVSRRELNSNNELLEVKQEELQEKESAITNMSELIKKNKQLLIRQTQDLELQKKEMLEFQSKIKEQTESLAEQNLIIKNQTMALYGSIVLIFAVIVIIILIYRSAKLKQKTNKKLEQKNTQLEKINAELTETQAQLVAAEKMAALGGLVAGVAHEINTPVGVSVTSATHISDVVEEFRNKYQTGDLKRSELEQLLDELEESGAILNRNLVRASDLIRSFKQVSVDQTTDEIRQFNIRDYLNEVIQNLRHKLKQRKHKVIVEGDSNINVHSFAGIFAQVFTNLIVNSIIHGFGDTKSDGIIKIDVRSEQNHVVLDYFDDGKGIPDDIRQRVFDPFFTTNRTKGGTGLGLHICYNLVTQKLNGDIQCLPTDSGAHFRLTIPTEMTEN